MGSLEKTRCRISSVAGAVLFPQLSYLGFRRIDFPTSLTEGGYVRCYHATWAVASLCSLPAVSNLGGSMAFRDVPV